MFREDEDRMMEQDRELEDYGDIIQCRQCGEDFPEEEIFIGEDGELFCSGQCSEAFEALISRTAQETEYIRSKGTLGY